MSIHDEKQKDRIQTIVRNVYDIATPPLFDNVNNWNGWIGLYRSPPSGARFELYWTDSSPFDYGTNETNPSPWVSSNSPSGNIDQSCGQIWKYGGYRWDDTTCDKSMRFICNTCNDRLSPKYILIEKDYTWQQARSFCRSNLSTDLASIHSDDDNFEIKQLLLNKGNSYLTWIGYNDIDNESEWKWSDGSDGISSSFGANVSGGVYPWHNDPNQPSNSGGDEDCTELRETATYA